MWCEKGVQGLLTTVGAFAAFGLMTIAISTDYWLYTRAFICNTTNLTADEPSRGPGASDKKDPGGLTHSGLWRICCLEGGCPYGIPFGHVCPSDPASCPEGAHPFSAYPLMPPCLSSHGSLVGFGFGGHSLGCSEVPPGSVLRLRILWDAGVEPWLVACQANNLPAVPLLRPLVFQGYTWLLLPG